MPFRITFVLPYTTIGIQNCALNRRSVDLDSWEVSFSSTVNLMVFNGEHLMEANRTTCIETCSAGRIVL